MFHKKHAIIPIGNQNKYKTIIFDNNEHNTNLESKKLWLIVKKIKFFISINNQVSNNENKVDFSNLQ